MGCGWRLGCWCMQRWTSCTAVHASTSCERFVVCTYCAWTKCFCARLFIDKNVR
ncbi:hypothetical protein BS78_07G050800 [Paspalum vaginatum]|nr:hypothetical protein BS78_07G050800 [Paspalum vaginatum]